MACFLHAFHVFENVIESIGHILPGSLHHAFGRGDHVKPPCLRQCSRLLQYRLASSGLPGLLRAPNLKISAHLTKRCFDSGHEDFLILTLHLVEPRCEREFCGCLCT